MTTPLTTPLVHRDALDVQTLLDLELCTVIVGGDVDASNAAELGGRLAELFGRRDVLALELDLTGVTYLGAAGLRALVAAHQTAERTSRTLRIRCGSSRAVRRPLQITGLDTVLPVVDR